MATCTEDWGGKVGVVVDSGSPRDYIATSIWEAGVQRHIHTLMYLHSDFKCPLGFFEEDADTPATPEVVDKIRQAVADGFEMAGGIWSPSSDLETKPRAWVHLKGTSEWRDLGV